ncbi:MAG: IclR family transcriptional regulator [Chloroflexales bacterium]|nr:IclR family transcriptional regulator [Chloroflexales bacterium]
MTATLTRHVAVPALERGLNVLLTLANVNKALTLAEISNAIGASRSTVYSILATLQDHGFVTKDTQQKSYQLGVATFELGSAYLRRVNLIPAFNECSQRLVALCRETVKLAILDGRDVVYLGKQDGLHSVRLVAQIGSRMPAHATAVGKVLLAQISDAALNDLYAGHELLALTRNTIRDLGSLLTRLDVVRRQGYDYDYAESNADVHCVAAPVRDHSGSVIAAMSIGVPNDRLSPQWMQELTGLLLQHAQELSRTLGWAGSVER